MTWPNCRFGVALGDVRVGTLNRHAGRTWFEFDAGYLADVQRPILGLHFEENLSARFVGTTAGRLPRWFSNLLPEGPLREMIAAEGGIAVDDELGLLALVGNDLPGAVRVQEQHGTPDQPPPDLVSTNGNGRTEETGLHFSLAGVRMKFSMLRTGERLTIPAHGAGGDWIVKLPDPIFADVPRNEHTMMSLSRAVGIETPECELVPRERLENLPPVAWLSGEDYAYAVRRFDRGPHREPIHIEDLAQVRDLYPDYRLKYRGTFESVASYVYRGLHIEDLREFARRMTFNILIGNGDAHLKNWSLIYRHPQIPRLAPCYDVLSTAFYRPAGEPEDLGLKFGNTKRFDRIRLGTFDRLERKLSASGAELAEVARRTVTDVVEQWPAHADMLAGSPDLRQCIDDNIRRHTATLLRTD